METLFSQGQVNRIFRHIPTSTLLHWAKMDVIPWSGEAKDGRGVHRLYSTDDLYVIGLVEELTALNMPLETIRMYVTKFFFKQQKDTEKKDLVPLPWEFAGVDDVESLTISAHRGWYLVLALARSGRDKKAWGTSLQPNDSLAQNSGGERTFAIYVPKSARIITNIVINLSEVLSKVDGFISEEG